MIFPIGATRRTQHHTAADTIYDAVVVGGGISGAIIADELSRAGKRVLVLEAGIGQDHSLDGYEGYLERFYAAASKDNQSPYPANPNAPMPRSTESHRIRPGQPDSSRLPRPERSVRYRHHLHPGARRHHHALGGEDPPDAARGLRPRRPATASAGTGRSATRN